MINISIYGAGHLTKSLLTGLGRVSATEISIFNRTGSKITDLNSIYSNLEKKDGLYELIKELLSSGHWSWAINPASVDG